MSDYIEDDNEYLGQNIETKKPKHTYKEINCGGECGDCVALVVDGEVVSGPPFHPNCRCSLSEEDIADAPEQESNLDNPVGANRNSDHKYVVWLKNVLNKLGFYEPDTRADETSDNLNRFPNQKLFDAIDKFQRKYRLRERGVVKPGYQTEAKINKELQHQIQDSDEKATFEQPVNVKPGQYAVFDGKALTLYMDNKPVRSWDAVSGKTGYQSPEYQNVKDKGTIPEGMYIIRKDKLQFYKDIDPWDKVRSVFGRGTWRGGTYSWGGL